MTPPAASQPLPSRPVRLQATLLLLCVVALGAVARIGSVPRPFLFAFGLAVALRVVLGRSGDRLIGRRALRLLGFTIGALSVGYLIHALGQGDGAAGGATAPDPLMALMCVVSVFQGLCLLCKQTTFTWFLLILLSSVHASGAAIIVSSDAFGLVFVAAYVLLLGWTLLHFERRVSLDRRADPDAAVRLLRAPSETPVPVASALRTLAVLAAFGFPLGVVLYLAAPRGLTDRAYRKALADHEARQVAEDARASDGARDGRAARIAHTGPSMGKGIEFGDVSEVKKDMTAWLEVREVGEPGVPRDVVLRDRTHDTYHSRGAWTDNLSGDTVRRRYVDLHDGRLDEWTPLGSADDPRRGRTLDIEFKQGGNRRLYLEPEPVRVRILRDGRPWRGYEVSETRNRTYEVSQPLKAGDHVLARSAPARSDDAYLRGRRSDSAVSPSSAYLQVPDHVRAGIRRHALAAVGGATDPWTRARRLEAWLQSEDFTYTLKMPAWSRRHVVLDFLDKYRSASCEVFASALVLMLRALGHPARHVVGLWGGDAQKERGTVVLRGLHFHAWAEMYLEGAGWVPLNPTPPDRRAADMDSTTKETGTRSADAEDEAFSFLGYGYEDWSHFWQRVGRGLDRSLVQPVSTLFSSRAAYAGPLLLLVGLWLLMRRRERVRLRARILPAGGRLPPGAYGKALMMLARKGMRRRANQTPRAFARATLLRFPNAREPLRTLTGVHELERYGGGASESLVQRAAAALRDLKEALRPRSQPPQG